MGEAGAQAENGCERLQIFEQPPGSFEAIELNDKLIFDIAYADKSEKCLTRRY